MSIKREDSYSHHWFGLTFLIFGSLVIYLYGLTRNEYANTYITAAIQAGADNWKAFFFGSVDIGNSVTLPFIPIGLWPSMLTTKLFGLSPFSLLLPQAMIGFFCVIAIYFMVFNSMERAFRPNAAALMAGWGFLLTPLAALAFRYNYPDALMTLLLILILGQAVRSFKNGSTKNYLLLGGLFGFSILVGQLTPVLLLPGLIAAWALNDRKNLRALWTIPAAIVGCAWYMVPAIMWPADNRPWFGGTTNNNLFSQLIYSNGWAHLANTDGAYNLLAAICHPFGYFLGGQMTWFLPLALLASIPTLVIHWNRPSRPMVITWSFALYSAMLIICLSAGGNETLCYTMLAPMSAVVASISTMTCIVYSTRSRQFLLAAMAVGIAWAFILLFRASGDFQAVRFVVLVIGLCALLLILGFDLAPGFLRHRVWKVLMVITGSVAFYGGPFVYTLDTISTGQTGSSPTAGPKLGHSLVPTALASSASPQNRRGAAGQVVMKDENGNITVQEVYASRGSAGAVKESSPSDLVVRLLRRDAGYRWSAACSGGLYSASLQINSEKSILPIGGHTGDSPNITLEQFQQLIADGEIHYYVINPNITHPESYAAPFDAWVKANYSASMLEGVKVYDLTGANTNLFSTGELLKPSTKYPTKPDGSAPDTADELPEEPQTDPAPTGTPPTGAPPTGTPPSGPRPTDTPPTGAPPSAKKTVEPETETVGSIVPTTTITVHVQDTTPTTTLEPAN
ncbi:MAG: glycosyltransferase family 39 protein [Corynebacterium sp.]|nr:glycosyltransferase family 39 protein [Corynebacterium sp.]